jgi:hypothetical protein
MGVIVKIFFLVILIFEIFVFGVYQMAQTSLDALLMAARLGAIQPGCIFLLPVDYQMPYPPSFVEAAYICDGCEYNDGTPRFELDDNIDGVWRQKRGDDYYFGNKKTVAIGAKVRPFLVFEKMSSVTKMQTLVVPEWYRRTVIGFPLTKAQNIESNQDTKINYHRLLSKNDYEFIHLVKKSTNPDSGLDYDDVVVLARPVTVKLDYFTHRLGALSEQTLVEIRTKLVNLLQLN